VALLLDLQMWVQHGLTYHIDGKMVTPDTPLADGCELALLPPVSGG
jgi:molybdopterin converting factor small subunit